MPDVVVIGAGLSGLAAAAELERLNVKYTLIEVKPRVGGEIASEQRGGFALDSGPMCHALSNPVAFSAYLAELGLEDAFFFTTTDEIVFNAGTDALITALHDRVHGPLLSRMAVSTLGYIDDAARSRCAICMENGMLLDACALIVAAPARYAERMFHTLNPEISYRLLDYRYDAITRLSLGYHLPPEELSTTIPDGYPITGIQAVSRSPRTPSGATLIQVALRFASDELPADPVGELAALMGWPLNPVVDHIAAWPESDPLMWRDPSHSENMLTIQQMLPEHIALVGSDYLAGDKAPRLDDRVRAGVDAARKIAALLA